MNGSGSSGPVHSSGRECPVIGRARCEFWGGISELVYVSELMRDGAVLIGLEPIPAGTLLSVEFELSTGSVPPVSAQVVAVRRSTRGAAYLEHRIRFRAMSTAARDALGHALEECATERSEIVSPAIGERRDQPRVWVGCDAVALVTWSHGIVTTRLGSLSHGGAFLAIEGDPSALVVAPGSLVDIDMALRSVPERFGLTARVVRYNGPSEPFGMGLRFLEMSRVARARLDGVIRYINGSVDE